MKRLEQVAQVFLIAMCCVSMFVILDNWHARRSIPDPQALATKRFIGKNLTIKGSKWSESGTNVVLAISSKCKYCLASIPLYREISAIRHQPGSNLSLTVVSSDSEEETVKFLKDQELAVDHTYSIVLASIGVDATPTVFVVNRRGIVRDVFVGRLADSGSAKLLKFVSPGSRL